MASSFYSNAQHVDFESVLGMDDHDMVSMFEALMVSGLRGFLGCPAVVYEDALVDFFENTSVRNGVIISTVGGQLVEISEKLLAESFELPVDGFGDLSEIPKDAIFDARSLVSLSGEPISLSGRKNQMKMPFRLLCDIMAKAISVKAGSFNAITVEKFSLMTAVVCGVKMNWAKYLFSILKKMVTPGSKQAKGFAIQISLLLTTFPSLKLGESSEFPASKILTQKTVHRFVSINDRDGAEEVSGEVKQKAVSKKRPAADIGAAVPKKKRSFKKKSVSSISTLEMVAVAEEAVPIQQVAEPLDVEEPRCSSADAVDLIIQQVLDETRAADAPADTAQPAVSEEKHWFDLPYEDLVARWEAERPVVTASDTEEDIATVDVAPAVGVQQVDDAPADTAQPAVSEEKHWFDLPYEDLVARWEAERPVVTASDTEEDIATVDVAPAVGVQQVEESVAPISAEDMLSADEQMSLDDILLTIPVEIPLPSSCMEPTRSMCTVEPCADKWVKIPRKVVSTEVPRQRQYDDTLPSMSVFFRLMRKRWTDVCLEVVEFCAQRLLPVGSTRFCRSLQLIEPVSNFASSRPTVFALRFSQFCSVFIDLSLFNWFPSTEITEFLSAIALDKTVLRSVQSSQDSFSVAPRVQLSLEQQQSSSSSSSSSSSLHFDQTDIDATASSRPPISQDLSAAFADFQAALSEQMFASQSDISSRMHKLEQSMSDSLRDQADIFRNLSQGARQEVRTLDDVHTICFNEFRKHVLAQNASIFQGLADVRQEMQAVNAKVDIMVSRLNAIQKDAEATKEALSHQLLEFQRAVVTKRGKVAAEDLNSLRILKNEGSAVTPTFKQRVEMAQRRIVQTVLDDDANRALLETQDAAERDRERRRREAKSGSGDKKGESGSRGPQQPANIKKEGSAVTPTFKQRVEMAQRRIVQTVLDDDANRALLETQDAAERDRERRRREAKSLKRRRRD
ncbi:hypothetical protein F511_32812 [Dorcoceras hygrometricum]|uniref:Dystroglycan-like n=1 Tax=Dorcoceras hygrometricum TaxID=472368 RepID=A0A2Z7BNN2_9LAMI|nr:hypothetical protein F511_32812 [Dorcoceras hygrometricum]